MKRHGLRFIKCGHIPAKADNEASTNGWKQRLNLFALYCWEKPCRIYSFG